MGAAAGLLAYAVKTDPVVESFQAVGKIPFTDSTYLYTDTRTVVGRPHMKIGLAGLAAVMVAGALEASSYARQLNAREQRLSVSLAPSGEGVALRVSLR
jgi:hypothetical protein